MNFEGKSILITGGTGSFGKKCAQAILTKYNPQKVIIYSRDELKQFEMQNMSEFNDPRLRFFIGDVRDKERLARAFDGVDYIIHAAALKQVPAAEYNPFEAVKTNIIGAQNIIDCAIDKKVKKVIALSTDKAANPINLYGATKLCSDKLFIAGNSYAGSQKVAFSVVRYGNVVGSRGSVVPFFLKKRKDGELPITDDRMTRFWITLNQGVDFVLQCLEECAGGEIFVPKLPSMRITDLANCIAPQSKHTIVGIRPGEKLHEVMVPEDDARNTIELDDKYIILPSLSFWGNDLNKWKNNASYCPEGFHYASDTNTEWLNVEQLTAMISELPLPEAQEWVKERG